MSTFISKLSELAPRLVIKQMSSLAKFLDSEVSLIRHSSHGTLTMPVIHSALLYHRGLRKLDLDVEQAGSWRAG